MDSVHACAQLTADLFYLHDGQKGVSVYPLRRLMLDRLKERQDFLAIFQQGVSVRLPSVIVQACPIVVEKPQGVVVPCVFGFTASRKVGNAVLRNKAKRRLRVCAEHCQKAIIQQWPHAQKPEAHLSRRTRNHIRGKLAPKSALTTTAGWAFVFVATKHTPVIGWTELVVDAQKAIAGCKKRWLERAR